MRATFIQHPKRGIFLVETLVGMALLGVLAAMAASAVMNYYHVRERYLWQQAAGCAGAAQLQRIQAGAPPDSSPPAGTVPEAIILKTVRQPGEGPWDGFECVTVTATVELPGRRPVCEQIRGYVWKERTP